MLDFSPSRPASLGAYAFQELATRPTPMPDDGLSAEECLVIDNMGLARRIARRFAGSVGDPHDLGQVALLGLVKAAKRFDPDRGYPFQAFASITISGEVKRYLRDSGWAVRPPRPVQELAIAVTTALPELEQTLQHAPRSAELAEHLGVERQEVEEAIASARGAFTVSLDRLGDGGMAGEHSIEDLAEGSIAAIDIHRAVASLPERDQKVLAMRFADGRTQREIAKALNVSQMQISRTITKSLARLRAALEEPALRSDECGGRQLAG
ncbi:sigma-70 family RNA polymerase sigma factor [Demequina sp. TTPB684]|uniref:sigma-70 family RNA polymerase sigma factor n=1 Tax=unclassified Demequina TaxID=2620311 RepID=UPI001CF21E34|nr:sigma-70 family RNA polymerase sigma factor [Demequina sp. TMPB413]MCB2413063.1 sigma-70 family RNA polymerase sigma factor [Demequina sp. TTPB684]UPU88129.1 sigma-70 family RNA polymerase sigma factor [Demequina sp. TMPB413]